VILFLFLSHLGLGIVFTLVFVSREAGVKFFRFNAGLAAVLILFAFAFRPADDGRAFARIAFYALAAAEAAIVLYWATVGRLFARARPAIVGTACIAGLIALVAQAVDFASGRPLTTQGLTIARFMCSSAFLGGACTEFIT
jgi:hypothetical protein